MLKTKKKPRAAPKKPVLRSVLRLLLKIVSILLIVTFIFTFVFGIYRLNDTSMVPNLNPGDLILYYRLDDKYLVSDTVVYNYDGNVKLARVVAIGGDTVDIDENGFKVNNSHQFEPKIYRETLPFTEGIKFPLTLASDEVFLLADNRDKATDSRIFGAVKTKDIYGKIFMFMQVVKNMLFISRIVKRIFPLMN